MPKTLKDARTDREMWWAKNYPTDEVNWSNVVVIWENTVRQSCADKVNWIYSPWGVTAWPKS